MYENHPYTKNGVCPCEIGGEAVTRAMEIYNRVQDAKVFAEELERERVIGKRIWYAENTIYISKKYACESGGGCPGNPTRIGERCHCDHYNASAEIRPKHYCKCGAEFYRPMFAPIFGERVRIAPCRTVLSGDEECVLAVRIDKEED